MGRQHPVSLTACEGSALGRLTGHGHRCRPAAPRQRKGTRILHGSFMKRGWERSFSAGSMWVHRVMGSEEIPEGEWMMLRKTLVIVGLLAVVAALPTVALAAARGDVGGGGPEQGPGRAGVGGEGPGDRTGFGPGDGTCDCEGVPAGDGSGYRHGRDN